MGKQKTVDLLFVIFGNFVLMCGTALFIIPNNILTGGVSGIAIALSPILPINVNITIVVLIAVSFVIGTIILGKDFFFKTALSSVLCPLFLYLLQAMEIARITENSLLASAYGGILMGVGIGLVFRTGASTGGMDTFALIAHKYTKIPASTLIFVIDGITVLLGIMFHGVEAALVGLISVFICSVAIDRVTMLGTMRAKSVMIISKKYEEIHDELSKAIDRGATLLHADGMYTREESNVLMVIIKKRQFPLLKKIVLSVDKTAFIVVQDAEEVHGEGFTFLCT